ncbi:hypothetical protein FN846DRAFT_902130 [Sphaerosporella brunnea]|uniref:Uncharacterized protein n=1 Tax=Sphaerosporella brunnea TaxID=1250544 RepID=A0A5J5FB33_9PEZI|nr:hypothetical protein FN846DRAFT_902130 [Sphaerosporella brunnea]
MVRPSKRLIRSREARAIGAKRRRLAEAEPESQKIAEPVVPGLGEEVAKGMERVLRERGLWIDGLREVLPEALESVEPSSIGDAPGASSKPTGTGPRLATSSIRNGCTRVIGEFHRGRLTRILVEAAAVIAATEGCNIRIQGPHHVARFYHLFDHSFDHRFDYFLRRPTLLKSGKFRPGCRFIAACTSVEEDLDGTAMQLNDTTLTTAGVAWLHSQVLETDTLSARGLQSFHIILDLPQYLYFDSPRRGNHFHHLWGHFHWGGGVLGGTSHLVVRRPEPPRIANDGRM